MDMVFDILCALLLAGIIIAPLALCEGLFNLAYRFIPAFRHQMDEFFATLPDWEE